MNYSQWLASISVDVGFVQLTDLGPNGLDGTVYGAMWDPIGGPGQGLPGAYEFDGIDDYISVPNHASIEYWPTDHTTHGVWVWVPSPSSSDDWAPVFSKGAGNYEFRHIGPYHGEFRWSPGASEGANDYVVPSGEWVFYCMTYVTDASNVVISLYRRTASDANMQFIDDYTVASTAGSAYASGGVPNSLPLIFGAREGTSRFFNGKITGYFSTSQVLSTLQMDAGYAAAFSEQSSSYDNPNAVAWRYPSAGTVIPIFVHKGSDFIVTPQEPFVIVAATANGDDGNVPSNVLDENPDTRWSYDGYPSILDLQLNRVGDAGGIEIEQYNTTGLASNDAYFDIYGSVDGSNWELLYHGLSDGTIFGFQSFRWPTASVSYLRYYGMGRAGSDWNSITRVRLLGTTDVPVYSLPPVVSIAAGDGQNSIWWEPDRPGPAPDSYELQWSTSSSGPWTTLP